MRLTHSLVKVMDALMQDPAEKQWGYELSRRSGVRSGALYPILHRLLEAGLLEDGWEKHAENEKRPPRRYYVITGEGEKEMRKVLDHAENDQRFAVPAGRLG